MSRLRCIHVASVIKLELCRKRLDIKSNIKLYTTKFIIIISQYLIKPIYFLNMTMPLLLLIRGPPAIQNILNSYLYFHLELMQT